MKRISNWIKPEVMIVLAGIIVIALVTIQIVLTQAMFTRVLPLQAVADAALWQDVLNDQTVVSRYNVLLFLLVICMFVGLAMVVVRNRRALEQEQAKLEEKIQTRTIELAQERNLLRTLIDNVPDPFYAKDIASHFILANQAVVHFMGMYSEKDLLGKSDSDFYPPELARSFMDDERALMQGRSPVLIKEELITRKDGRANWFWSTKVLLRDLNGQTIGLVGMGRDVTELHIKEEQLREREDLYHSLVETMPLSIFRKDAGGRITFGNTRFWQSVGCTEQTGQGKTEFDLMPSELAEKYHRDDLAVMAKGETLEQVEEFQTHTGERQIVRCIKNPTRDPQGKVNGVQEMLWDITQARRNSEKLREREELLSRILDTVEDGIYIVDLNGSITFSNKATQRIMGMSPQEVAASDYANIQWRATTLEGKPFPKEEQPFPRVMTTGESVHDVELTLQRENQLPVIVSINATPLHDASGKIIGEVASMTDITARKQSEEKLRASEQMLAKAQQIAHVGSWRRNSDQDSVEWSDEMFRIFGVAPDGSFETISHLMKTAIHPEDRAAVERAMNLVRQGQPSTLEYRILRPNGQERIVWSESEAVSNAFGNLTALIGVVQDITERKHTQAAERQLAAIVASSYDSIVSKTNDGIVTSWNQGAERLYGFTASEMIGQPITRVLPPEEIEQNRIAQERLHHGENLVHIETVRLRQDGTRVNVALTFSPMYDENGKMIGSSVIGRDITESKRAELALRQQNAYLDALHETMLSLIGHLEVHELLETIIQRAAKLVGTPHGYIYLNEGDQVEMKMSMGLGVFHELVGSTARRGVGATGIVWETGEPLLINDYQTWQGRLNKTGTWNLHSLVTVPLKSGGEVIGVFGLAHTDTNQSLDANALQILTRFSHFASIALENARLYDAAQQEIVERRQVEDKFRALFEASPDAILVIDPYQPDWPIVDCNQVAGDMNGYTRAELIGNSIDILNTTKGTPDERAAYLDHLRKDRTMRVESDHRHKDGHTFRIETSTSLIRAGGSELILGIDRDVTERRIAEQTLTRQKELLQTAFDNIPVMIATIDRDGSYTLVNQEWEQTLGYDLDEMNHGEVLTHLYPDAGERTLAHSFMLAPSPDWHDFKTFVRDGRELEIAWLYRPLSDGTTIALGQDVTQRKKVDRLKNEFISTVSHELRTPLTSIRGALGLIAGGVAGAIPERAQTMIDIAYKNSERLVRLINDILDIEKIESGKMEFHLKPLDLGTLLEQAMEANRAYAQGYNVSLAIAEAPAQVMINADADRMTQVLTNLLSNAVKFSPTNGVVEIRVTRQGHTVRVSVSDHGTGIPPEFRDRIFQKFAQADSSDTRQKGGTGLGLSIVKAIVEKHGGTLGFDSIVGKGTTFYFDLPEYQSLPVAPPLPTSTKPRVLIVEDDRDVAFLLSLMLKQGGFDCDMAYDAARARELVNQHQYAALTLDLMLPDVDGITLIRQLRAQDATRNLPIVVVSAKVEKGRSELNGDAFEVTDWLQKPIDQQQLVRAVAYAAQRATNAKPRILHIEDDADVLRVVQAILQETADITPATTYAEARALLEQESFDLVILDPVLPDGLGIDLLPLLQKGPMQIPMVIFSAREQDASVLNRVNAALIKSRTSNEHLVKTIKQWLEPIHLGETQ